MHRLVLVKSSLIVVVVMLVVSGTASAEEFAARFSGFEELGALNNMSGAILSDGEGTLHLDLDKKSSTLTYTLSYSGLTSNVTQAHIHFAKRHVAGGIFVFLCTNLGNGPAGTPACPATGGTVTGTITAAGVVAVPTQNITAGDFGAVEAILESNTAYGNIHTVKFPAGEIRGQVRKGGDGKKQGGGDK
jgi:hypothetical protein